MHRPHTVAPVALCAWHCALRRLSYANLFPPFFVHYAPAGVPTIALCAWHCAVNSFCYASKLSSQAAALRLAPLYRDHPKAHELLIALLLFWYAPLLLCIAIFQTGSCSSFVSELQRGMVEALLIPHCMIGPKRRIFRVRTLQPPHCKRWG